VSVESRIQKLRHLMQDKGLDVVILTKPESQFYITGFRALTYSRPIATLLTEHSVTMVVPGLEEVHAHHEARADEIHVYYEHPERTKADEKTAFEIIKRLLKTRQLKHVGIEDGYLTYGYASALASEFQIYGITDAIIQMRLIKDEDEIRILEEAGKVVSGAVRTTLENVGVGKTELEVEGPGNQYIFETVSNKYPNAWVSYTIMTPSGVERTVMPHVYSSTRRFESQDIAIHTRQVGLFGYRAECERTLFVGGPTTKQRELFEVMFEAQQAAIAKCIPGTPMKEVDAAARSIVQKAGYGDYFVHRTGHGIGLEEHEAPYIRFDNEDPLEVNMVVTIEPGIYVPGIGGFRHSDTLIVTEFGPKLITDAPSELEDLTF
jgi:Xaa-Pro dipeptidase